MKVNLGTLTVTSPDFAHGERMPDDTAARGAGPAPALNWSGVPEGTSSFAIIAEDADAPLIDGFVHWVVYGIPGAETGLPKGGGAEYVQGANGLGQAGWVPADPPPGHGDHFYHFHLYAIGGDVELEPGLSADRLRELIDAQVIAQARIVGRFGNG